MLREEQRAMPAYEEPPVLPGGSFFEDFSFICSPGGGWAARATEMGVNSCKWVCPAKRKRKIPLVPVFVGNPGVLVVLATID